MNHHLDNGGIPIAEAADACGGKLFAESQRTIKGISIDSRRITEDDLFVAVKGEHFDGHNFISEALGAGAAAVLCERIPENIRGNFIVCGSTVAALGKLAAAYKESIDPFTVGVTGSVGKTTVKQFIYSVLSSKFFTCKTEGNQNNQLGLPISLLSLTEKHKAAVFELAMSGKGEIEYLSKLARPDVAVITCIGTSHIEYLGSRENIRDAKMEIVKGLKPGGKLILNGDEPLLSCVEGAIYVSLYSETSQYRAYNIRFDGKYTVFDLKTPFGIQKDIQITARGEHIVYDAALAYAVGAAAGIADPEIRSGLLSYEPAGMRQLIRVRNGITEICDCYNAAPESMKASLRVLCDSARRNGGRAVAVLGDMRELGDYSVKLHEEVGETAAKLGVDMLFTFGKEASSIADGAEKSGMSAGAVYRCPDLSCVRAIASAVAAALKSGDTVLFKASRAVEMERVTDFIEREF
ncbi:MAG: UDP-N-acetylmuramoyl-tripeptide--D-alanyl-D-alanine ligase [Firmicutes bacterium]|nr:UDP-N-acetylmuramoyl-tripeptide--D-alanyl-D-alanine ligase [Bacillota bacterium]